MMMADHGHHAEERGPTRVYTPSFDSDEEVMRGSARPLTDNNYRMYDFSKEGRSWAQPIVKESQMRDAEIKKRAQKVKKPTHSVPQQLEKMSPPRRNAVYDLVHRVERSDLEGDKWEIVAIDHTDAAYTKRTGEVRSFSVILARASANAQRTGSMSQDRRRLSFRTSPQRESVIPNRRGSKSYHSNQSPDRDGRRRPSHSQSYKTSQTILEDDPFGNPLFSTEGKPINAHGSAPFVNAGLPPHIPLDEPIGAKKDIPKDKFKKQKGMTDDDAIDVDALLGGLNFKDNPDLMDFPDKPKKSRKIPGSFDDDIVEIIDGDDILPRGRKSRDKQYHGDKTPKHRRSRSRGARSRSKSKSRPRRPSIHIPRSYEDSRPVQEITSKRRSKNYYDSRGSFTTGSVTSDPSILEAEYEDYSSSGSSAYEIDPYATIAGEYRVKNYHRRGPPSPEQRYEELYPRDRQYSTSTRRPQRVERMLSDTAVTRYTGQIPRSGRPREAVINQAPRFVPALSAHQGTYSYGQGMTPYPGDRERIQADDAAAYIVQRGGIEPRSALEVRNRAGISDYDRYERSERDFEERDREIELLHRERDVARREAELHQEFARRASVRPGTSKYTHEPRLQRRYTEAAYDDRGFHA